MRGVDVAVDVGLDHGVHGDQAHAPDQLGVVAHLLRAQHDALAVKVDVAHKVVHGRRAERQRRGRGRIELAAAQHVEHAVLQHLGEGGEVVERAFVQPRHHGVGNVAHARLQWQQLARHAPEPDLVLQKFNDVASDALRVVVGCGKHRVAVGLVGEHHGDDLVGVAFQVGLANAVVGVQQRDRQTVRRQVGPVIDVVHALQTRRVPLVDLQNHLVGLVQPGLVVAHRRRRNQAPVGQHARHLDHGHIEFAQKTEPDKLRHMRQVHVDVLHLAGVDLVAAGRVGLVGQAHADAVGLGQHAVQLGGGGGAGPQPYLEALALGVQALDALRQRTRHGLGVARAGEAAHADVGASGNERCGLLGRHDAFKKGGVTNPIGQGHGEILRRQWWPRKRAADKARSLSGLLASPRVNPDFADQAAPRCLRLSRCGG